MKIRNFISALFFSIVLSLTAACDVSSLLPAGSNSSNTGAFRLFVVQQKSDGTALTATPDGKKIFVNDLGFQVTLSHAEIGIQRVQLISGGSDVECVAGQDQDLTFNGNMDLLSEDLTAIEIGSVLIPIISYCQYELVLGPVPLHVEGTWSFGGGAETPFEAESLSALTVPGEFSHPLHFHTGETEVSKTARVSYDALFDGVSFDTMTEDEMRDRILQNLTDVIALVSVSHP